MVADVDAKPESESPHSHKRFHSKFSSLFKTRKSVDSELSSHNARATSSNKSSACSTVLSSEFSSRAPTLLGTEDGEGLSLEGLLEARMQKKASTDTKPAKTHSVSSAKCENANSHITATAEEADPQELAAISEAASTEAEIPLASPCHEQLPFFQPVQSPCIEVTPATPPHPRTPVILKHQDVYHPQTLHGDELRAWRAQNHNDDLERSRWTFGAAWRDPGQSQYAQFTSLYPEICPRARDPSLPAWLPAWAARTRKSRSDRDVVDVDEPVWDGRRTQSLSGKHERSVSKGLKAMVAKLAVEQNTLS